MEPFLTQHLWDLILGFMLELWSVRELEEVKNNLGKVVHIDEARLENVDKRIARVLVEIGVSKGLILELDVEWRGRTFIQQRNYWKALFQCSFCRETTHIKYQCGRLK